MEIAPLSLALHSLFLEDDTFQELGLYDLFVEVIPDFNHFGLNRMNPKEWDKIKEVSRKFDANVQAFVQEVDPWVQKCFDTEPCFYWLGI